MQASAYSRYGCDLDSLFHNLDLDNNGVVDIAELSVAINKLVPMSSIRIIRALLQTVNAVRSLTITKFK
jgi:hypothetical protein